MPKKPEPMAVGEPPAWLMNGAHGNAPVHHSLGRYLWVRTANARKPELENEEERSAMFWNIRTSERERWFRMGEEMLAVVEHLRMDEEAASTQDLARQARISTAKCIRMLKEHLYSKNGDAKNRLMALKELPKLVAAVRDLSRIEQDMRQKDMDAWNGLTPEEQVDSFLAAVERWPTAHRDYLAARINKLFPSSFRAASKVPLLPPRPDDVIELPVEDEGIPEEVSEGEGKFDS